MIESLILPHNIFKTLGKGGRTLGRCVTFGEIMMRLNPEGYYRLPQATTLEVSYAGGEANAAVAVAQLGADAAFVTKVPEHALGDCAINEMRRYGVDTRWMIRGGKRLGVYFVEKGASQRASKVIYDRANSAIAEASRTDFDWNAILEGASWFHFTGITPALGELLPEICLEALKTAREKGIPVSCDLNYRGKLWDKEKACKVMSGLMPYVDVCIANEADAADVFGIHAEDTDVENGELNRAGYIGVAKEICRRFGCKKAAITLRGSISASENTWSGMLYDAKRDAAAFAQNYLIRLVDRVGGGDSFAGAMIYALMNQYDNQKAVDFAVAASCLKQTMEHDFCIVDKAEALSLAAGNRSGRVQR